MNIDDIWHMPLVVFCQQELYVPNDFGGTFILQGNDILLIPPIVLIIIPLDLYQKQELVKLILMMQEQLLYNSIKRQ